MSNDRHNPGALGREIISTSELKIQLWRNPVNQNWTVEINNKRYCLISFELVKRLVAQALGDSKKSLIEGRTNRMC
jgi:hypothetical protein